MTATERLRELLDERGVKWQGQEDVHAGFTFWCGVRAREAGPMPSLAIYYLTPEQAIEATLGAGVCQLKPWEMERDTGFYDCMECGCGYVADVADWAEWHYCPNCGRKVVDDG